MTQWRNDGVDAAAPSDGGPTGGRGPQGRIQKMNLEGANSGGLGDGSPGRGSGGRSPPEADDFSQLKGYLDVTSGILGGMPPLNPPVGPPTVLEFLVINFSCLFGVIE